MRSPRLTGWFAVRSLCVLVAGAALAISCGRDVTGNGIPGFGRFTIKPLFQTTSGNDDNNGFDQPVTLRVTVAVVSGANRTIISTNDIAFSTLKDAQNDDSESITVQGTFPLQGDGAQYDVQVQGINATGVVTYNIGPLAFTSAQAETGAVTVSGQAIYVGPGTNATSVVIAPRGGTIFVGAGTPLTLTAQAFAGSTALPLALYNWFSLNPSIADVSETLSATGQVTSVTVHPTSNGAGTAKIVVGIEGTNVADTVTVTVLTSIQNVNVTSGQGQSATVSTALKNPIVATVIGSDGHPLAGAVVTFTPQSGGSASPASVTTGADGIAQTTWTLGTTVGTQTLNVVAAYGGQTRNANTSATATSGTTTGANGATQIALQSGGGQTVAAGSTVSQPILVLATNAQGTPVNGAQISITYFGNSPVTFPTNSSGIAAFNPTVPAATTPGNYNMSVQISGLPTSAINVPITVTAGTAVNSVISKVSGDNQTAHVGQNFGAPLTIKVADQNGNPLSGVSVSWATGSSSVTVSTDASGQSSQLYAVPAGTTPGPGTITVTITGTTKSVVFAYTSIP